MPSTEQPTHSSLVFNHSFSSSMTSIKNDMDGKGSVDIDLQVVPASQDAESASVDDKALLRKLDWNILPAITVLYLMSFLDRSNIGNAVLFGLKTDLNLVGNQFNIALAVFYLFYVVVEAPSNALLRRWSPRPHITLVMVLTSFATLAMGFVTNFASLTAVRALLGIFEGGLYPGLMATLQIWYRRDETAYRACLMYSAASLSGAFGGLLARLIQKMDGVGGKAGWEWIFIIEGLLTFLLSCGLYPWIVDLPTTSKFLTPAERTAVVVRLKDDGDHMPHDFQFAYIKAAILDWKVWCMMLLELGSLTSVLAFGNFAPTIVNAMGFTAGRSQLLVVPPYAIGCLVCIVLGYYSDKTKTRYPFIMGLATTALIGYIILATCQRSVGAQYFATFLVAAGALPLIPLEITWNANCQGGSLKKAVAIAMQIGCANLGGITGAFTYRAQDKPHYLMGHLTCAGFLCMTLVLATIFYIYCKTENARRDTLHGSPDDLLATLSEKEIEAESVRGDHARWFRYML